jgi:hypothetical protein
MSLLLLFRPYRWGQLDDDSGGDTSGGRRDPQGRKSRLVFKIPRLGVAKKIVVSNGKRETKTVTTAEAPLPWQAAFASALERAKFADISRTLENIGSTDELLSRLERDLSYQDLTSDEHILSIETYDPLLIQQIAIITAHLALLPSDEDLLLAYMMHRQH